MQTESVQIEKLSADEAAELIMKDLDVPGYTLAEKVAISRVLRKLLRQQGDEAMAQLRRQAQEDENKLSQLLEVL